MNDLGMMIDFLSQYKTCVLATIGGDHRPQAATVTFSENDLGELIIDTYDTSRKYGNLKRDSRVALVVGFENLSLQYEGVAHQLSGPELEERLKTHFAKLPEALRYKDSSGQVYFSISPTWMRLTNTATEPWEVHEVRFDDARL